MSRPTNPYVMLHDERRYIGYQACTVTCRVLNDVPEELNRLQAQAHSPEREPGVLSCLQFVHVSCQHCEDVSCISVCPTGTSFRDENDIVQVDESHYIGYNHRVVTRPFHARCLNSQTGITDKCSFCADTRLGSGQPPTCVPVCLTGALKFSRRGGPGIRHQIGQREVYYQQDTCSGPVNIYRRRGIHQEGKA